MDAALLWLLIAASRGAPRSGGSTRHGGATRYEADDTDVPARASVAPLRRLHARSAWLRALEEIALVDRRMKPSLIRKVW